MKFSLVAVVLSLSALTSAFPPPSSDLQAVAIRDADAQPLESTNHLVRRKGGGGGKGGSSGSGKGGSGGGGRSLSSYSFSPQSNVGGRTISGSGTPKAYGNKYTGGAVVPYTAGGRSPSGVAPFALGTGAFLVFPGIWLYSSLWAYPWGHPYYWYANGRNHSSNVTCVCEQYQVCGCDPDVDTNNSTFLDQLILNGTDSPVNSTLVRTVDYGNGSVATFINGTLENGTTADGGTEPSNESQISAAFQSVRPYAGYGVMVLLVTAGIGLA